MTIREPCYPTSPCDTVGRDRRDIGLLLPARLRGPGNESKRMWGFVKNVERSYEIRCHGGYVLLYHKAMTGNRLSHGLRAAFFRWKIVLTKEAAPHIIFLRIIRYVSVTY